MPACLARRHSKGAHDTPPLHTCGRQDAPRARGERLEIPSREALPGSNTDACEALDAYLLSAHPVVPGAGAIGPVRGGSLGAPPAGRCWALHAPKHDSGLANLSISLVTRLSNTTCTVEAPPLHPRPSMQGLGAARHDGARREVLDLPRIALIPAFLLRSDARTAVITLQALLCKGRLLRVPRPAPSFFCRFTLPPCVQHPILIEHAASRSQSMQPRRCRRLAAAAAAVLAAALMLLAEPTAAAPIPFIVPDGAVKLWADDFDAPRYSLNSSLWARVTGKPGWQLQVRLGGRGKPALQDAVAAAMMIDQVPAAL